jgi:hypothetical protein
MDAFRDVCEGAVDVEDDNFFCHRRLLLLTVLASF